MGIFDFDKPPTKKQKKRATIKKNQRKGKAAEDQAMMRDRIFGFEVEKTGKGHDYKRTQRDILTGSKKTEYIEVKSGDAKLSPLQKKTKKKKRNYKVVREDPLLF